MSAATMTAPASPPAAGYEQTIEELEREALAHVESQRGTQTEPKGQKPEIPSSYAEQQEKPEAHSASSSSAPRTETPAAEPPLDAAALAKELEKERERVRMAQKDFHEGRMERARLKKDLEETRSLLSQVSSKVDQRLGPDPETTSYDKAMADLKEVSPELYTILDSQTKARLTPEQVQKLVKQELEKERASLSVEAEKAVLEQNWRKTVQERMPNYFDIRNSSAYKDWYAAHPNRVTEVLSKYDNLDPEGGLQLMEVFMTDTGQKAPRMAPASEPGAPTPPPVSDIDRRKAAIAGSPSSRRSAPASRAPADAEDQDAAFEDAIKWIADRRRRG